nr:hypothetical protein 22 [Balneolaceae bacterium]
MIIKVNDWFGIILYFAAGMLVYLLAYGQPDWSDAWVYVIAALWPFVLLWWLLPYAIGLTVLILLAVACMAAWDHYKS